MLWLMTEKKKKTGLKKKQNPAILFAAIVNHQFS